MELFPCGLFGSEVADVGVRDLDEIGWGDFELQATETCAHIDCLEVLYTIMYIYRERLFQSDGAATSAEVSSEGKELLHGYEVALFVARYLGGFFEVDLVASRDDTYKILGFISAKNEGFEHLMDVFAQLVGNMLGTKVGLIHPVGDELIMDFLLVEQACCIGLRNSSHEIFLQKYKFFSPYKKKVVYLHSIRIENWMVKSAVCV